MNYFQPKSVAERYAIGRPYFHEGTIYKIKDFLRLDDKVETALDIACGTGLSTKALLQIAKKVYGTDTSAEMLALASEKEHIHYQLAVAEAQPFEDNSFDLITVCSGVHWFDIEAFLKEAHRLLKPEGWLILYENYFLGEMMGKENTFKNWLKTAYLFQFPSPARNDQFDWTAGNLSTFHFDLATTDTFKNDTSFSLAQLVLYFTTQSNITNAIASGKTYEKIEVWLTEELRPFFEKEIYQFQFGNWIKYLQKHSMIDNG